MIKCFKEIKRRSDFIMNIVIGIIGVIGLGVLVYLTAVLLGGDR